jgi:hypothetical protein
MALKTNFPAVGAAGRANLNKFYEHVPGRPNGNVYYVDSVNGSASGDGWSPESAFSTVALALAAVTANTDSVIVLLPGHNEGIGNAQLTWDKAGTKIIGIGEGPARPRFDFDHANASIDITASGMTVENITLLPSVTAVLVAIDVNAAATHTTLRKIESLPGEDGAGVDEFAKTIDIKAGCTRTLVENCQFTQHASAAGVVSCVALTGASDLVTVRDCTFWTAGAGLVAPINGDTTLSTRLLIERCVLTTDAEPGIELLTGTTGVIRDCDVFGDLATIDAAIVADACAMFECRYVEVGGEASAATYIGVPSVDD